MVVKTKDGREFPVEMYRGRTIELLKLPAAEERLKAIEEGCYNTFQLKTKDLFLDMLTDSGVNSMTLEQWARWMTTDDAYAGSMTFYELAEEVKKVLGYDYVMNIHQAVSAEHLLAKVFIKPGDVVHILSNVITRSRSNGSCIKTKYSSCLNSRSLYCFRS